jgi:AraC-like DNA-binding protein/quercetin dioxygenase-like cupin family protein
MVTTQRPTQVPVFCSQSGANESFRLIEVNETYSGCHWHFHPEMQVGHVIGGTGERAIGDSLHAIEPGEVILLGPNLPHVWRYDVDRSSARVEAIAIHFKADFLGAGFLDLPELRDVRLLLSRACQGLQFVGEIRKRLAEQLVSLRMQHGFERLLQFLQILHEMAGSREVVTLSSSITQPFAAELEQKRLQRVFDFVAGHFPEGINREAAADLACLSPSAFSRFFKAHTGLNFSDYVADVRVGHACQLLLQPQIPINAIALRCGFEDLSTFNRAFRKRRAMSPSAYRRRMAILSRIGEPAAH